MLNDIIEHGSKVFSGYVAEMKNPREKKEALNLVTSQFLSCHSFAESMNQLLIALTGTMKVNKIEDLMVQVSKSMGLPFSAETIHLWMADSDVGVFYTYNKARE